LTYKGSISQVCRTFTC